MRPREHVSTAGYTCSRRELGGGGYRANEHCHGGGRRPRARRVASKIARALQRGENSLCAGVCARTVVLPRSNFARLRRAPGAGQPLETAPLEASQPVSNMTLRNWAKFQH